MTNNPSNVRSNRFTRFVAGRSDALAIALILAAFGIYWLSAVLAGHTQSPDSAYFNDLANAFLHGQLYLSNPTNTRDLTLFNGNWYVPFPPLPALLLLPWVAVSGLGQVNTVLFVAVMAALNVALAFLLLQALTRRGWTQLSGTGSQKITSGPWRMGSGCDAGHRPSAVLQHWLDAVWLSVQFGFHNARFGAAGDRRGPTH